MANRKAAKQRERSAYERRLQVKIRRTDRKNLCDRKREKMRLIKMRDKDETEG